MKKPSQMKTSSETGIKALFVISLPLMLSCLSGSLMLLCDRLFLAQYSLGAFNSIVTISSVIVMLQIGMNVCASAADVFVGQLNGADEKLRLSAPVWQIIWLALFSFVFFLPLAVIIGAFWPKTLGSDQNAVFYGTLLIAICPLSPIHVALSSFFIGRKQTMMPFVSTILGNIVNLALNFLLIFGVDSFAIPAYGAKGAALATAIAQFTSLSVLIIVFFSKTNRITYQTCKAKFDGALSLKILKLGYPNAIAQVMIASAWSCFFILMNRLGEQSITLASFMQTLTGFFAFIIQGLSRGIIAISSNLIGSKKGFLIIDTLLSGIKLSIIFSLFIFLMYIAYPKGALKLFFHSEDLEKVFGYFTVLTAALLWGWLAFVCKSIRALLSGVLISSGQTRFVMQNEVISIWLCFIVPIWLCVRFFPFNISWAYFIAFIYNLISTLVYSYKLARTDWVAEKRII